MRWLLLSLTVAAASAQASAISTTTEEPGLVCTGTTLVETGESCSCPFNCQRCLYYPSSDTSICERCKNKWYLYQSTCHESCSGFPNTFPMGEGSFSRRCVDRPDCGDNTGTAGEHHWEGGQEEGVIGGEGVRMKLSFRCQDRRKQHFRDTEEKKTMTSMEKQSGGTHVWLVQLFRFIRFFGALQAAPTMLINASIVAESTLQ